MCGIAGYTHLYRSFDEHVLALGLEAIRHRGPDHQGRHRSAHISMGATRLRIIDIDNGDQPFRSEDGQTVVVFNGEIFNHKELRGELESLGAHFHSRCDTEVVLQGWLHWGTACFTRFRGMFAIAVWEEQSQRLLLARDRMGIKPLYYARVGDDLDFGSELKCLFTDPQVPRTINYSGLNCFLELNYVPAPMTLASGIVKLRPGGLLEWHKGHVSLSSYVQPAKHGPAPSSLDEASEELDELLQKAVAEELSSDVPLGVWLSGGLDSSSVLHYAAQHSHRKLKTFSVTFRGKSFDESQYIQDVTRQYGVEHTEFDLAPQKDLADVIAGMAYYSDEPSADAGAVPVWYLSRMTRQSVTTVLSGEGADELFGGYLTYQADRYRRAIQPIPNFLKKAALFCTRALPVSNEKIGFDYKIQRFLEGSMMSSEAAHVFWNGTFTEEQKRKFFRFADPVPMRSFLGNMRAGQSLERYLDFDRRYSLPDGILYKADRMSMAHAVEARPPFLDDRIVDFARRLPRRFKINGGQTKLVLRHLMRSKLPASVLHRPKVGFDIPIHEWFRGPLRALLLDTLSETALNRTRLFSAPAIHELIGEHLSRRANWGYHLWGLMTLMLWIDRWKIETPEDTMPAILSTNKSYIPTSVPAWQPASYPGEVSEAPLG